jgi:ABC-type amino acid transport substrate-binding protein
VLILAGEYPFSRGSDQWSGIIWSRISSAITISGTVAASIQVISSISAAGMTSSATVTGKNLGFHRSAFTAVAQPLEGRLKIVRDTATLRIADRTDSRPFSFLDAQGQPTGYAIELCERIGKSIERELALPSLAIKWIPVDARSRFETIIEGSADIECGSTSVSLSRMRIVDFSRIIFAS